ncbi:MAG: Ig-like domain-containing protein [Williamsia sp.]|nr:Ig-like domain-containing protein [Williamsia sp.]
MLNLIFFILAGCQQHARQSIRLVWTGKQATGIRIPGSLVKGEQDKNPGSGLQVFLENGQTPMLGASGFEGPDILFKPLIALSPGKQYSVLFKKKLIGRVRVPSPDTADAPVLLALYPAADSLPENLLKIYLVFSAPMQEGEALHHTYLLNERADTISNIFLDLQPELWNRERTALTIWLDPGRIKRGLIPNERMGNPLKQGARYTLLVDAGWKSAGGLPLRQVFKKSFYVNGRDSSTPVPSQWKLALPRTETLQPLEIAFNEPLDYFLAGETLRIVDEKETPVRGNIILNKTQTGCTFRPARAWQAGTYRLQVATYLEDLAGNNLNKVFDRDITVQQKKEDVFIERRFVLAP